MSRPTLKRLAELSGLSESTVSRVLRGRPATSPAAREAVANVLRSLGVEPPAAPAGSGPRPELIAVVSNALVGPDVDPYETVALALNRRIFSLGHIALRSTAGLPAAGAVDLLTPLLERGAAGVIVLGGAHAGREAVRFASAGLPVVRISNARHAGLPQFVLDASSGIATAVRHLVHMGHRRIGFAVAKNSAADERISAFRREIAQTLHVQATRAEAPVALAGSGLLAGAQAAEELLERGCTAAISSTPALTMGFLEATERARLRMPEDFSLLTVGDIPDADVLDPPMSQVTYDWTSLAESAVAELLRIAGEKAAGRDPGEPAKFAVVPDLVLRASVRPVQRR